MKKTILLTQDDAMELLQAYYQLISISNIYDDAVKEDGKKPITTKWKQYLLNTRNEFQTYYDSLIKKNSKKYAPFIKYGYCVDPIEGSINYCEQH